MDTSHKHTKLIGTLSVILLAIFSINFLLIESKPAPPPTPPAIVKPVIKDVLYTGKIYNMFFHSLIVYPKLAFDGTPHAMGYQEYMVTRSEFLKILPKLYGAGFILIDPHLLLTENTSGTISQKPLYLPPGKKPLILSFDDMNYYTDQDNHGFANKLTFDQNGNVATEITTPEGQTLVTRDGDTVPILDDFVAAHPDFSHRGMKGVIAVTGYEGVLGYRTNLMESPTIEQDRIKVKTVVAKLKETGWLFGSHSYSHGFSFRDASATLDFLKYDTKRWEKEVQPLVGKTDLYIGPFGQVFQPNDKRRDYIVSLGFKFLFGVGMDQYIKYFPDYLMMDRANIDGIRLLKTPHMLKEYFNPEEIIDPERGIRNM